MKKVFQVITRMKGKNFEGIYKRKCSHSKQEKEILYCKDWNELINYIQALFLYIYTETNGKFNGKYQVTNSLK